MKNEHEEKNKKTIKSPEFWDIDGVPIDADEWRAKSLDKTYRRVGSTLIGNLWVSTVWIGSVRRLGYNEEGEPLLFLTCIFQCSASGEVTNWKPVREVARYARHGDAMQGHHEICQELQTRNDHDDSQ
jgi:hypothetical protein